jgi:hypothetical protein
MFSGNLIPADVAQQALAAMDAGAKADTRLMAEWFAEFFLSHALKPQTPPLESAHS